MFNNKKILLTAINAKYIHSNLAVYSLKKYAEDTGADIEIAEYTINQYVTDIVQSIYLKKPQVIAFSCYIWNRDHVGRVIEDIVRVLPDTEIWVGGPEGAYNAAAFMEEYPEITGIMIGEGENIFKNLVYYYTQEAPLLSEIKGIIYRNRENGKVITNPTEPLLDMSSIPFPYDNLELFRNKIIYYESSRGCPFSCSYCLSCLKRPIRHTRASKRRSTAQEMILFFRFMTNIPSRALTLFICALCTAIHLIKHSRAVFLFHTN